MKVLMVSSAPSLPATAGNRARIHRLLQALIAGGHETWFAHVEREPGSPEAMQQDLGERYVRIPWHEPEESVRFRNSVANEDAPLRQPWLAGEVSMPLDLWYDEATSAYLRNLQDREQFDAVIVAYVFLSKALTVFDDNVLKICDTHDRFGDRHRILLANNILPDFFYTTKEEESRGLGRADVVLAIQPREERYFSALDPALQVRCMSHLIPEQYCSLPAPNSAELRCVYCGSDNSSNVRSMQVFLTDTWPLILKRLPQTSLHIAGKICNRLPSPPPGVCYAGHVDNLNEFYSQADIALNPTLMGTGIKIKSLEALGFRRPLLSTPQGAVGLEGIDEDCGCIADLAAFPVKLRELAEDPEKVRRFHQNTARYVDQWNQRQTSVLDAVLQIPTRTNTQ